MPQKRMQREVWFYTTFHGQLLSNFYRQGHTYSLNVYSLNKYINSMNMKNSMGHMPAIAEQRSCNAGTKIFADKGEVDTFTLSTATARSKRPSAKYWTSKLWTFPEETAPIVCMYVYKLDEIKLGIHSWYHPGLLLDRAMTAELLSLLRTAPEHFLHQGRPDPLHHPGGYFEKRQVSPFQLRSA